MKLIGLTGSIACGKSTVSNFLNELGAIVIDADLVARSIVEKGQPALSEIVDYFGHEMLNEDGTLNRKLLGSVVFADKDKLQVLNKITHLRIREEIKHQIEYNREHNPNKVVVLDNALLIETEQYKIVDEVWVVTIDRELQIERLMKRGNHSYESAINMINAQMSSEEKSKYATFIIDNSKDFGYLKTQIYYKWKEVSTTI